MYSLHSNKRAAQSAFTPTTALSNLQPIFFFGIRFNLTIFHLNIPQRLQCQEAFPLQADKNSVAASDLKRMKEMEPLLPLTNLAL